MTRATKDRMTLIAGLALLAVINLGDRHWMPPSGLNTAVRLLETRTSLPMAFALPAIGHTA